MSEKDRFSTDSEFEYMSHRYEVTTVAMATGSFQTQMPTVGIGSGIFFSQF